MSEQKRERVIPPLVAPNGMADALAGCQWARNCVGESGGNVYRLSRPNQRDLYLKHGRDHLADDITNEMVRMRWLNGLLPVPELRHFTASIEEAWLLMTVVPGKTAYQSLEENPDQRVETVIAIAAFLRHIHQIPTEQCLFNSQHTVRMAQAQRRLEAGQIDTSDFSTEHQGWTAEQVWDEMSSMLPMAVDPVLTHGDFSLDNILVEEGSVTGCIDLDRVGIADRYQDLAIVSENLGEFDVKLKHVFFNAYGITQPDEQKIAFHLLLDECF